MRLIDADALYEQIAEKEELARQRVLDTPSRMPNGDFNPSAMRYATQLDERTQMKFMIADAPTVDAVPVVRCKDCRFSKAYYHGPESNLGMFTYLCTQGLYGMNADDYCSRAKRKEE